MDKKRLSLNLFGQICSLACSLAISFFITPYVVNNLGAEVYGFVGLANNFTGYIALVIVALNGMLSRYVTIEYSKKNYNKASGYFSTAFIAQIFLGIILIIPMMVFANKIDVFLNISNDIVSDVKLLWTLIFGAFIVSIVSGSVGIAPFVKNRLEIQAAVAIVINLLRSIIIIIAFLFFTPKVWYIGLATVVANLLKICIDFRLKQKLIPEVEINKNYFDFKYIKNLLIVGIWNSLNRLQQILYTGLDLLLTNLFINGAEMGLLSVAKTVPTQISTLISSVSGTFDPGMTIAYGKGDKKDFLRQTLFAMKFNGFFCSVPIIGVICFGMSFYSLWIPTLSHAEVMKVQILAVLTMLPQVFSVYIFPLYTVNTITCKLKVPVLLSIGIGITNISIVLLLLKFTNLGVYAVAGVSSILWILRVFTFVPLYAAWNINVKLSTFYMPLLKGVLNVAVMLVVFFIIMKLTIITNWIQFFIVCGLCAMVGYAISFCLLFEKEEKIKVLKMIRKKFFRK